MKKENETPSTTVNEVTALSRGAAPKLPLIERIKRFRKSLGMTQEGFGRALGESEGFEPVSAATVNRWEAGTTPRGKYWQALIQLANEQGGLRQLVGTDERELMMARLEQQCPRAGMAVLVDFGVGQSSDLNTVVSGICSLGSAELVRFVALGDDAAPKKEAMVLMQVGLISDLQKVQEYFDSSKAVQDYNIQFKAKGIFSSKSSGRHTTESVEPDPIWRAR